MITALVALVVFVALVAIVGGVKMMLTNDGCFFSWYMGFHAFDAGLKLFVAFFPLLVELIGEAISGILSNN